MKGMISIAAGVAAGIAGLAVGTAVAIAVNKAETKNARCMPKTKMGKWTTMAMDAMGEAFHNVADLMK